MRSHDFYPFRTRLMSIIMSISLKIKFSVPFIYVVFQINQSEKSTHLLIDDKIYQWSKVNNFFTFKNNLLRYTLYSKNSPILSI